MSGPAAKKTHVTTTKRVFVDGTIHVLVSVQHICRWS